MPDKMEVGSTNGKPLKRKDKVYNKLRELTESLRLEKGNNQKPGFDASFIGGLIGVSRNNTSKELNRLVREGRAIKVGGKPVLYLARAVVESKWELKLESPIIRDCETFRKMFDNSISGGRSISDGEIFKSGDMLHGPSNTMASTGEEDKLNYYSINCNRLNEKSVLENIIGAGESLKAQIEQAKAAVLYPPGGLHTLIVGPTGVGKTTFAEAMYRYALEVKRLPPGAPFIVFNCADYAENPQLLMSHLFGHAKGAFTGADREKRGLVENADGGILFLDEVHRLPPEGQEMMFLLMDRGIYRRLGESGNTRKARVLIIAATTEEPEAAMLSTFLRRIPVVIRLPGLQERTLHERMALICRFFMDESARIKASVRVSKEVIKAFMLYDCPGNIGQLKSDIQLICARAFLDYMTFKKDMVEVKLSQLSQRVREGFFKIGDKREELIKNFNLGDSGDVVFNSQNEEYENLNDILISDKYSIEDDFYNAIQIAWKKYEEQGLSDRQIREKVDIHIRDYFDNAISKIKPEIYGDKKIISKVVSLEVFEAVEEILRAVSDEFGEKFNQKVIWGIALHVGTLMERLRMGTIVSHPDKENVESEHKREYEMAKKIKKGLEERLRINIPEDEIAYLAIFLYALKAGQSRGNIGILVIAHGHAAASTMAHVANTLLGCDHARALDMPLDEKVEVVLNKAVEEVKKIDRGKGVLILVDMGSLVTFSQTITEKTGIPTRSVEMVSTPMVIEATRKALMPDMDIDTLVEDVKSLSPYIGKNQGPQPAAFINEYGGRFFQGILVDILGKTLTFLNPQKACSALNDVLEKILADFEEKIDDDITIKFLFHCSCMVERLIKGEPLLYSSLDELKKARSNVFAVLRKHFEFIEDIFGINIPDSELAYVVEMLDTHFDTLAAKLDTLA